MLEVQRVRESRLRRVGDKTFGKLQVLQLFEIRARSDVN